MKSALWIAAILCLCSTLVMAEDVSITITVGGVRTTHEVWNGDLTEFSRDTESVSVTVNEGASPLRSATRVARQIASEKEASRTAFVKMAADKICPKPKFIRVEVPKPYPVDRPVYVDRPVVTERVVLVDRPIPAVTVYPVYQVYPGPVYQRPVCPPRYGPWPLYQ